MYVCKGEEYTGMNDQINKQRNKFNQFLIDKQITKFMPPQKPNNHLLLWNSQNHEHETEWCVARKKPVRCEKTKPQTATVITYCSVWFCDLLHAPVTFIVIGHYTIYIPEVFQVFMVF